jgi:hypothetical protein
MPTRSLATLVQCVAILCITFVAGAVFGIWRGFVFTGYSQQAYLEVHQGAVRGLNVLLPVMGFSVIACTILLAWLARRHRRALVLYLTALACTVAAGLTTRFLNQPINAEVMRWTLDTMPADWNAIRESWWAWHLVRLVASAAASVLLIAAVFVDRDATAADRGAIGAAPAPARG